MEDLNDLPDLGSLPTDVDALQAILKHAESRLCELKQEEADRRKRRFIASQRRRQQAAAVASVPTPQSAVDRSAHHAAAAARTADTAAQTPRSSGSWEPDRTCEAESGGAAQVEQRRGLEEEIRSLLAGHRERLREALEAAEPTPATLRVLREAPSMVADLAELEGDWAHEESFAKLREAAREAHSRLERWQAAEDERKACAEVSATASEAQRDEVEGGVGDGDGEDAAVQREIEELRVLLRARAAEAAAAEAAASAPGGRSSPGPSSASTPRQSSACEASVADLPLPPRRLPGRPGARGSGASVRGSVRSSGASAARESGDGTRAGGDGAHAEAHAVACESGDGAHAEARAADAEGMAGSASPGEEEDGGVGAEEAEEAGTGVREVEGKGKGRREGDAEGKGGEAEGKGCGEAGGKGSGKGKGKKGPGAPPPKKGASKAAGKGAGPPPPPPKSGAVSKAAAAVCAAPPARPGPHLVSLRWTVRQRPEDLSRADDALLGRLDELASEMGRRPEDVDPEAPEVVFPDPPQTMFAPLADGPEPPMKMLELYFKKVVSRSAWKQPTGLDGDLEAAGGSSLPPEDWRKSKLTKKVITDLDIVIQRHLMENKGQSSSDAIFVIRRAILRCDFHGVRTEGLGLIRNALRDEEGLSRLHALVAQRGAAALDEVEHSKLHRFIYQLSTIPQIEERLECMLFHIAFRENLQSCQVNLRTLRRALQMLNSKRDAIQRFFVTAHRLGQSLNRGSSAQQAPEGFQLSTLEKLKDVKSTKFPKFNMLHFIIALVARKDPAELFTAEETSLLQRASMLKTHKVYSDCVELAQGIYAVQQICETGKYTRPNTSETVRIERRRKSIPAQLAAEDRPEPTLDTDDRFYDMLHRFVEESLGEAEDIAEGAFEVILTYKELALYFDDLKSVYPPPEQDERKDLCEIFCKFAEELRKHREDVEAEHLRRLIEASAAAEAPTPAPHTSRLSLLFGGGQGATTPRDAGEGRGAMRMSCCSPLSSLAGSPSPAPGSPKRAPRMTRFSGIDEVSEVTPEHARPDHSESFQLIVTPGAGSPTAREAEEEP